MKYDFRQFASTLVYILRYMMNGRERSILLRPIDASNGVIMDDIDDNGIMHGLTLGGNRIELPFKQFLSIEPQYSVTRFNGQTSRTEQCSEERLNEILENSTDQETGEVSSDIRDIKEIGNDSNRVTRYESDLT